MITVRNGVFETNSSSTHCVTIMSKEEYEQFQEGLWYDFASHQLMLLDNGTKIKATGHWAQRNDGRKIWVPDDQDHLTYTFPENFDIKITDYCEPVPGRPDGGICVYCHENSSPSGKHGDVRCMETVFRSLLPGTEAAIGGGVRHGG